MVCKDISWQASFTVWERLTVSVIPQRPLGSTGQQVSIIGLGGAHIARPRCRSEAVNLVREAVERGITFMDNCWDYHEGRSEMWMGDALKGGYRDRVLLMTKIDGQNAKVARKQLDQSLKRLKTDHVDLLQMHEVIRPDDPERIFARGGAIEALMKARDQGKARYLGFTGHKHPETLLKMLEQDFPWDAVQMPVNLLDSHFRSFQEQILPLLRQRGVGVIAMKPLAGGALLDTGMVTATEALQYSLSQPVDVVVTGIETHGDLEQALEAAADFVPLDDTAIAKLHDRVKPFAGSGEYEPYKTTTRHDGTVRNPQWLVKAKVK